MHILHKTLAAAAFFVFLLPLYCSADESGIDRNKDGKADRWIEARQSGGQIVSSDNNYDGVIDYILEIDEFGNKIYEETDFNLDGSMDDFYFYSNGVLVRQEIDTNYDNKIDIFIYLEKGIYITKVERDKNFDGIIDYTKQYK
ncbi:MAG: hypothetical protein RBT69_11400 [Spirochaetia bacterium]|jgi:hypothetical protein|nr:hypothetical protein [Spirochaetia bacterium]